MKIIFLSFVFIFVLPLEAGTSYICYRSYLVKLNITYDMFEPGSKEVPGCTFHFAIDSINPIHIYISRRWQSVEFCKKFAKKWKEYKAKRKRVCLAGPLDMTETTLYNGLRVLERSGYWKALKFKDWCESHFEGEC